MESRRGRRPRRPVALLRIRLFYSGPRCSVNTPSRGGGGSKADGGGMRAVMYKFQYHTSLRGSFPRSSPAHRAPSPRERVFGPSGGRSLQGGRTVPTGGRPVPTGEGWRTVVLRAADLLFSCLPVASIPQFKRAPAPTNCIWIGRYAKRAYRRRDTLFYPDC